MPEDSNWRTTVPTPSTTTEPTVVRPDSLNISTTAIQMDILTPKLLQFLQRYQPTAESASPTPEAKVLEFLPQLTKSFAEATGASSSMDAKSLTGTGTATTSAATTSGAQQQQPVLSQNSFIISSGPPDSSSNQNFILISPIGSAAAAVSSSLAAVSAAVSAASAKKEEAGPDQQINQEIASSSTSLVGGMVHETSSLPDSDTNRPTRPSSSDSSLMGGSQSTSRKRGSGSLSTRPINVGDNMSSQMLRLEQKRARNRDAARRCRERKIKLIETLEKKVSQLSETNRHLQRELAQTQSEVECLRQFVESHFKPAAGNGCSVPLKG